MRHEFDTSPRGRRRGHRRSAHGHRHGRGRHRARRGAVAQSTLIILAGGPKHGYDIITELDRLTDGAWKPSAGAMYPALGKLEERGLIVGHDTDDGKREYELTEAGRQRVAEMQDAGDDAPWEQASSGGRGELRSAIAELVGPARQIGRFGTPQQAEAAKRAIADATAQLYRILADGPATTQTDPADASADDSVDDAGDGVG